MEENKKQALTQKQKEVLETFKTEQPRITILSGAKRSGKTYINNLLMLSHIAKFAGQEKNFLVVGATAGSVWRNVMNDWETMLSHEFKRLKDGSVIIFGNRVFIFGGEKSDSWKKIRGMTSHGTYINEATALNKDFFNEVLSRTSGEGARIFIDTNPSTPAHYVKKEFIDKAGEKLQSGRLNIMHFKFRLDDNDNLGEDYIESIKATTPAGANYERDILGNWTAHQGLVYKDFDESVYIEHSEIPENLTYLIGVDWGFTHYGACVAVGFDREGNYYITDLTAKKEKYFDFWKQEIMEYYKKYKVRICYCDSARPEYVAGLRSSGINGINANKSVLDGIETVARLMKAGKMKISKNLKGSRLEEELYSYSWEENDKVVKTDDDVLDAIRYAIYSNEKNKTGQSFIL